jgi:hypothetical protein
MPEVGGGQSGQRGSECWTHNERLPVLALSSCSQGQVEL